MVANRHIGLWAFWASSCLLFLTVCFLAVGSYGAFDDHERPKGTYLRIRDSRINGEEAVVFDLHGDFSRWKHLPLDRTIAKVENNALVLRQLDYKDSEIC